jgi:ankyrin repeat protein
MASSLAPETTNKGKEPQRRSGEGGQVDARCVSERGGLDGATTSQSPPVQQLFNEKPKPLHDLLREMDEKEDGSKEQLDAISKQLTETRGYIDFQYWCNTALHIAVSRGLSKAVDALLQNGAQIDGADEGDGLTALHHAVLNKRTAVLKQLLDNGANVLATNIGGTTPLLCAAWIKYEDGINLLMGSNQGLSHSNMLVNKPNDEGYTPLMAAVISNHHNIVTKLLEANADARLRLTTGETCLHWAIWQYSSDIFSEILERGGVDIDATDEIGATVLHYVCGAHNRTNAERSTIRERIAENSEDEDTDGSEEELKVLKQLLGKSADPLIKTPNGETALHFAVITNRKKLQQELLNFLAMDKSRFRKALLDAATHSTTHSTSAKLLLSYKEQETNNTEDLNDYISAIEWAAMKKEPQILWWLIATSPRTSETHEQIQAAKAIAEPSRLEQSEQQPSTSARTKGRSDDEVRRKLKNAGVMKAGDATDPEVVIRDILDEPPIAQVYRDSDTLKPPICDSETSKIFEEFKLRVIQVYKGSHISNTIRRDRTVQEVIYTSGPARLMESVKRDLKDMWTDGIKNIREDVERAEIQAMYDDEKLRFTWIHLPVTNVSAFMST